MGFIKIKYSVLFLLPFLAACFGPSSMLEDSNKKTENDLTFGLESKNSFSEVCKYDGKTYTVVQKYIDCMIEGNSQQNPTALNMQCEGFIYNIYDANDSSAYINCKIQEAMANVPPTSSFSKECDGRIYTDADLWAQCVQDLAALTQNPNFSSNPVAPPAAQPPVNPAPSPAPNNPPVTQGNTSCVLQGEKTLLGFFHDCTRGPVNRIFCKYQCKLDPCKRVEKYHTSNVRTAFDLFAINYKRCQANLFNFPGDPRGTQCRAQCIR